MNRLLSVTRLPLLLAALSIVASAANTCTTIQSGLILYQAGHYLAGQPIATGVNPYGYNYQAHAFSGNYINVYTGADQFAPYNSDGSDPAYDDAYVTANPGVEAKWYWPYRVVDVAMKWNDAWLSNQDCDGDGLLDRHYGYSSYKGSGAWTTNHDSYLVLVNGKYFHADDFIKVVAIPADATIATPASYFDTPPGQQTVYLNGKKLGDQIWDDFAVIEYVANDKSAGAHGLALKSWIAAGFGKYQP